MREILIAWRRLRQQPSFGAAAIVTLALGIAAPTAVFAVVNALVLRPLPYPAAEHVYTVRTTMTDGRFTIGLVASEEMSALRRTTDAVIASGLVFRRNDTLITSTGARQLTSFAVSPGFFEVFALPMAAGRAFSEEDFAAPPLSRVILSQRAWRTLFGANPAIVGSSLQFGESSALVVGIAPEAFAVPRDADVWFAARTPDSIGHMYDAFVRFRPGTTPATIAAQLPPMWDGLAQKYPDQAKNRIFVMRPLLDTILGDVKAIAVMALAATGFLLLLAMVNVANLLLARGTTRARETAVRTALGATRWDTVRPVLAESILITGGATVVALPLAALAVRMTVMMGGATLPRGDSVSLDPYVFAFVAAIMIVAATLVSLIPAFATGRVSPADVIKESGRSGLQGRATTRTLGAMVVVEVMLVVALVAGCGRLLLSMRNMLSIDPGFTAQGRLAIDVLLPDDPYRDRARLAAWAGEAERRLRTLGATQVETTSSVPLRHEWDSTAFVDITNRPTDPASRPNGRVRSVSPGFFDIFRIPILAGRSFTIDDRADGDPVVIVNRAWARKFIPDLDPLRERVSPGRFAQRVGQRFVARDAAIIGVVGDVPYADVTKAAEPTVYVVDAQSPELGRSLVITTADGHPERLSNEIRTELARIDARVPIDLASLSDLVPASLLWPRLGALLMTMFSIAGLVLAASGVFGVIAFIAAQRSPEMAVRLALGATPATVFRLIVRYAGLLALQGVVLGIVLAAWTGRLMQTSLYQVTAGNWIVLTTSAVVVLSVCLAATLPSARRAAATPPALLLR
jgi:putative ABC transport system permease protein